MNKEVKSIKEFIGKFKSSFSGNVNTEIREWSLIKDVITFFMDNDEGSPIVDFIDVSNWDSVESYSFNDELRLIEMVWHDYKSPENDLEISVFGAHKIKCEIIIESVVITGNQGVPVVLLKGFYRDKKEINKTYNTKCSDYLLHSYHPFSWEAIKVVKKDIHRTIIPNINCFTTSLVPNCARFISANDSKKVMYDYNLKVVSDKVVKIIGIIGDIEDDDQDELQAKGNTVRKHFENALKILNLKAGIEFKDDYQKLMLGNLSKIITNFDAVSSIDIKLPRVIDILNACSHDSGIHISKDDLMMSALFVIGVINTNE